jgi:hypothetical protein
LSRADYLSLLRSGIGSLEQIAAVLDQELGAALGGDDKKMSSRGRQECGLDIKCSAPSNCWGSKRADVGPRALGLVRLRDPAMSTLIPSGDTPLVVDTNVLLNDLVYALRNQRLTALGMSLRTSVREFASRHVADEVDEHLGAFAGARGVSVSEARAVWNDTYSLRHSVRRGPSGGGRRSTAG